MSPEELKEMQAVLDSAKKLQAELDERNRCLEFLLNEYKTNKRWFREEPGKVTTPTQNQEEGLTNKVPIEKEVTKAGVEAAKEAVQKEQSKAKEEKSEKSEKPKEERKSLKAKLAEKKHEVAKEKKDKTLSKENEKVKGGAR